MVFRKYICIHIANIFAFFVKQASKIRRYTVIKNKIERREALRRKGFSKCKNKIILVQSWHEDCFI